MLRRSLDRTAPSGQKDLEDALKKLTSRRYPRAFVADLNLGPTAVTSAVCTIKGLPWITLEHVVIVQPGTVASLTANVRALVTKINPGDGVEVTLASTTAVSGSIPALFLVV